jgi:uncharacterized membrane protein YhhN
METDHKTPNVYDRSLPPIPLLCELSLAATIASAIILAIALPRAPHLLAPVLLAIAAWVLIVVAAVMVATIRPFNYRIFKMVGLRQLIAELIIAGMLEFVFLRDHLPTGPLVVFSILVGSFSISVALLMGFQVARWQEPR